MLDQFLEYINQGVYKMPKGKGTYGSKVGRPKKRKPAKKRRK
jgi:hypothetical protein